MSIHRRSRRASFASFLICALLAGAAFAATTALGAPNTTAPSSAVKLVFIHHSTGSAWLQNDWGNLGKTLGTNNYFVSDTNYGWGPSVIGDSTDIGNWWTWFRGPSAPTYTAALYANTSINSGYARTLSNPGGENSIVMFKSCFPNSAVGGSPSDAVPAIGSNPLKGGSGPLTVGNAKGIYLDLLEYFKTKPDKMFVLIVSPPLRSADTNSGDAANARYLANWLCSPDGLLKDYTTGNVFVYDYYTVLTGGHHRVVSGMVEHSEGPTNYLAYPTGDSHPSAAGDQIATAEYVPMLNAAYNSWKAGTGATLPPSMARRTAKLSAPYVGKSRVSRKSTYTWRGSITPAQIGTSFVRVELQRKGAKGFRKVAAYKVKLSNGASAWSMRLRIKTRGTYRLRVSHVDGDHFSTWSSYRGVSVR
jgi:hypothetical protein